MTDEARFEALRTRLGELQGRSRALARQLGGLDLGELRGPGDLALIPVMRKSAIAELQAAEPPFGALAAAPTGAFQRLFASPEEFTSLSPPDAIHGARPRRSPRPASLRATSSSIAFPITSRPADGSSKAARSRLAAR